MQRLDSFSLAQSLAQKEWYSVRVSITKDISTLQLWLDKDLVPEAKKIGLQPDINKGWFGLLIENMLGMAPSSKRTADRDSHEIKSVALQRLQSNSQLTAKETMAVTMVSADTVKLPWRKSHVKPKLNRVLAVGREWHSTSNAHSELRVLNDFNLSSYPRVEAIIKKDYKQARKNLRKGNTIDSSDGLLMQVRPKGAAGSNGRAFYLRKPMVNFMLGIISEQELLDSLGSKLSRPLSFSHWVW